MEYELLNCCDLEWAYNACKDMIEDMMNEHYRDDIHYVQVSREMAMDAGDLSLEGMWTEW